MTSFSTASSGVKAPTLLLPGRDLQQPPGNTNITRRVMGGLQYVTSTTALETAVDVTGSGVWTAGVFSTQVVSTSARVVITIDGIEVLDDSGTDIREYGMVQVNGMLLTGSVVGAAIGSVALPFLKSLKIQCQCNVPGYYTYNYYLT